jgi:hypothetical protein
LFAPFLSVHRTQVSPDHVTAPARAIVSSIPKRGSLPIKYIVLSDIQHISGNRPCLSAFEARERRSYPMLTIKRILLGLVVAAGTLSSGQALAERVPSPEERSRIETILRNEGFTRWGKIELDDEDDVWEIDDAHASDGHRYDLRLHPDTLAIITREPYDD